MAVVLFKNGQSQKFDEYTFTDRLNEGWTFEDVPQKGEPAPLDLESSGSGDPDLDEMTRKQLEEYARGIIGKDGKPIELDRRMNKKNMLKDFNEKKG